MVDQHLLQNALHEFAYTLVRRYEIGHVLYRLSDDVTSASSRSPAAACRSSTTTC